ncbi:Ig-like domain-containing protein [bacterium]|nr:Ig-like domain-containing protein [bacterium]
MRRFGIPLALALSCLLTACPENDEIAGTLPVATPAPTPSGSSGVDGQVNNGGATPKPAGPTVTAFLLAPADQTITSAPLATPSARQGKLTVSARYSDNRELGTTANWSWVPNHALLVEANGNLKAATDNYQGTVIVTAASGSFRATVSVRVTATPLTVTSLTLSPASLTLYVPSPDGQNTAGYPTTGQLLPTVTLSDGSTESAVVWTVSNPTVATVSASGLVTALQDGSVTLTAKAAKDPKIAAVCNLTVLAKSKVDVIVR